jgi:hypothetical protein
MIDAAVPELELEGLAAERQPEDLMSEADAEERHAPSKSRTLSMP